MSSQREAAKRVKRQQIIQVSRELFAQQGYEKTSINEIVAAVQLTKRTLYRYFVSKEDLYFAVALDFYRDLWQAVAAELASGKTGLARIEAACWAFQKFCQERPGLLRIMGQLNLVSQQEGATPYRTIFFDFNREMFRQLQEVFETGIKDGSLKNDQDVSYMMSAFIFSIIAFFNLYGGAGQAFLSFQDISEAAFMEYTLKQYLATIRN